VFYLNKLRIIFALIIPFLLVGCKSDNKDIYKGMSADQIYARAKKNEEKERYGDVAKDYEALESRFPYGEYSDRSQIGLINAYYKNNDSALAITAADRFIRMNPHHPNVDYVYYLKGLVTFEQNYTFAFRYLPLDRSSRDPSSAQESFDTFKEMLDRFPHSQYAPDARKRMVFLRNQLASHELQVAEYYVKRRAYASAANRASYIIKHFEKTPSIPKALAILVVSYQKLGMQPLAKDAYKTLEANYPGSQELKSVQDYWQ